MPLPRGASQAAVGAGCAGDWQKRQAKRGGTHAACAPVEGACERRSRVRCGADRSLGEWQRLWIGSNVGWGVVSCRRRFARWNPKRADPSARALFYLKSFSPPYTDCRTRLHEKRRLMTPSCRSDKGTSLEFNCCMQRLIFAGGIPPLPSPSPPLRRGERDGVRGDSSLGVPFSPDQCTLTSSCRFPLPAGGTERVRHARFPAQSKGNQTLARFSAQSRGEPTPCTVPLAKRGEPHGGGQ
jgi:hypothetical protein